MGCAGMDCDQIAAHIEELNEELYDHGWDIALGIGEMLLGYGEVVVGIAGEIPSGGISTGVVVLGLGTIAHGTASTLVSADRWDRAQAEKSDCCALWKELDC